MSLTEWIFERYACLSKVIPKPWTSLGMYCKKRSSLPLRDSPARYPSPVVTPLSAHHPPHMPSICSVLKTALHEAQLALRIRPSVLWKGLKQDPHVLFFSPLLVLALWCEALRRTTEHLPGCSPSSLQCPWLQRVFVSFPFTMPSSVGCSALLCLLLGREPNK